NLRGEGELPMTVARHRWNRWQGSGGWFLLSLGTCALLAAFHLLVAVRASLAALLLIGPMLACTRLDARRTAVVAGFALLLALSIGTAYHALLAPDFIVCSVGLLLGSALAVHVAGRYAAAQTSLTQVTDVARAAQEA